MDLEKIFEHMSQKMEIEWARIRESISHPELKGTALEKEFKRFLEGYLPASLKISSGIIVDSSGNESKQMDVIIHDAQKTPLMFNEDEIKVVPVECVYAVIEVKAKISSSEKLNEIFENMKSVKDLEKISYIRPIGAISHVVNLYGKEWEIWPVHYFVFAIDSINLVTIGNKLTKKNQDEVRDVSKRVDCICVLKKGVLMNKLTNGKYSSLPEPGSIYIVSLTEKPLLFFYRLISNHLLQAWIPSFQFTEYTKNIKF